MRLKKRKHDGRPPALPVSSRGTPSEDFPLFQILFIITVFTFGLVWGFPDSAAPKAGGNAAESSSR